MAEPGTARQYAAAQTRAQPLKLRDLTRCNLVPSPPESGNGNNRVPRRIVSCRRYEKLTTRQIHVYWTLLQCDFICAITADCGAKDITRRFHGEKPFN